MGKEPGGHGASLLIRADAGPGIGAGHVMRCLALAQAWKAGGGIAHFRLGEGGRSLEARLVEEGMAVSFTQAKAGSAEDAREVRTLAASLEAAVVADGYAFKGPFQTAVKEGVGRLLSIDDNAECAPHSADLILNQNPYADGAAYGSRREGARMLLGSRFALLRREFLEAGAESRARAASAVPRNILVTMGGGDPDNATLKVVRALQMSAFPGMAAKVVVGALNPNLAPLREAVSSDPGKGIELVCDPRDMPGLMAWADVAIAAAGSTVWELLYMGIPSLLIVTADNQRRIAASVAAGGAAMDLGWHTGVEPAGLAGALKALIGDRGRRQAFRERGGEFIDGKGAARVAAALAEAAGNGAH